MSSTRVVGLEVVGESLDRCSLLFFHSSAGPRLAIDRADELYEMLRGLNVEDDILEILAVLPNAVSVLGHMRPELSRVSMPRCCMATCWSSCRLALPPPLARCYRRYSYCKLYLLATPQRAGELSPARLQPAYANLPY